MNVTQHILHTQLIRYPIPILLTKHHESLSPPETENSLGSFKCPTCRQRNDLFRLLPTNYAVMSLLEMVSDVRITDFAVTKRGLKLMI